MQLSKETINVIKNFSTINGNLLLKPGSKISTISAAKSVYAEAVVSETFDETFGIYDTNEFLGALSIFNSPNINFGDGKCAIIKENNNSIKYFSAEPSVLIVPTKEIKLPEFDIHFDLSSEQIGLIMKTCGVLKAEDVIIRGANGKLIVEVGNKKNVTGNAYSMEIGETVENFVANMKVENLKLMPGDYAVSLSKSKIVKFVGTDLFYVVSLESDSQF